MIYTNEMKRVFRAAGISKVAIVDDAFDAVDISSIERSDFLQVRTVVREMASANPDDVVVKQLERRVRKKHGDIFANHDDQDIIEALWSVYVGEEPGSPTAELLAPIFRAIGVDKKDKLRPLKILKQMLVTEAKVDVAELDSTTVARDVLDYDLIFLDFYLGSDVPNAPSEKLVDKAKNLARERSIQFLQDLVELTQKQAGKRIPLVMLISSMAKPDDLPAFRAGAKMLASKMAFLPKEYAEKNTARMQHTIIGLAQFRGQADALWNFLEVWKDSVDHAATEMMSSLRELDLTDYSYMQEYRLTAERTPLSQYISSLFSGRLVDMVEREMDKRQASAHLRALNLPQAIPGRVSPTAAITDLYSSLTTSRVPIAEGDFKPKAWAGDIFVDLETYNEAFGTKFPVKKKRKTMPKVLAVVTPACDLIPERAKENPLRMVTMVGGDLIPLSDSDVATTHLLMLNQKPYVIKWNTKWPFTVGLDSMKTSEALAGRYKWAARLRDLHHAELQHMLFADVGRVGVPVSPVMSEYVGVTIFAKTGAAGSTNGLEVVLDHPGATHAGWTFATKKERAFCLRDDIAWTVREWVHQKHNDVPSKKTARLVEKADLPKWLNDMHRPILFKKDQPKSSATDGVTYLRAKKIEDIDLTKYSSEFVVVFITSIVDQLDRGNQFDLKPADPALIL